MNTQQKTFLSLFGILLPEILANGGNYLDSFFSKRVEQFSDDAHACSDCARNILVQFSEIFKGEGMSTEVRQAFMMGVNLGFLQRGLTSEEQEKFLAWLDKAEIKRV